MQMQGMRNKGNRGVAIYVEVFFLSITQQMGSLLLSLHQL